MLPRPFATKSIFLLLFSQVIFPSYPSGLRALVAAGRWNRPWGSWRRWTGRSVSRRGCFLWWLAASTRGSPGSGSWRWGRSLSPRGWSGDSMKAEEVRNTCSCKQAHTTRERSSLLVFPPWGRRSPSCSRSEWSPGSLWWSHSRRSDLWSGCTGSPGSLWSWGHSACHDTPLTHTNDKAKCYLSPIL